VDGVLVITQIFSMLAAFAAIVFAYATVRESQALRREERVARLPDLIVDIAAAGARIETDQPALSVAQARCVLVCAPWASRYLRASECCQCTGSRLDITLAPSKPTRTR
jgi:hypothetical protein